MWVIKIELYGIVLIISIIPLGIVFYCALFGLMITGHDFLSARHVIGLKRTIYLTFIKNAKLHLYAILGVYLLGWMAENLLGEAMRPLISIIPAIVLVRLSFMTESLWGKKSDRTEHWMRNLEYLTPVVLLAILSIMAIAFVTMNPQPTPPFFSSQ